MARGASWLHEPWPHPLNTSRLTRLELVAGWVSGVDPDAPDILDAAPLEDPLSALERALIPSLEASPCRVAFSGGRDSSVLLALAVRVARREGLPPPVPVTLRWPGVEESQEREWQERVVAWAGLDDWIVLEAPEDLDLLGDVATAALRQHGLMYPSGCHAMAPLFTGASGGSLILGDGGDQIFGGWRRASLADLVSRRRRPERRDLARMANAAAPRMLRAAQEALRIDYAAPWVRPWVGRAFRRHQGRSLAAEPLTWPAFLQWSRRERVTVLMLESWGRLARAEGIELHTPFWDPVFLSTLARWGGRFGRGQRTLLMEDLFGELLPPGHMARRTKAVFTKVMYSATSSRFAREFNGQLPEEDLVHRERLRAAWLSEWPPTTAAPLLQAAWLLNAPTPTGVDA